MPTLSKIDRLINNSPIDLTQWIFNGVKCDRTMPIFYDTMLRLNIWPSDGWNTNITFCKKVGEKNDAGMERSGIFICTLNFFKNS